MKKNIKSRLNSFSLILKSYEGHLPIGVPHQINFAGADFYKSFFDLRKTFQYPGLSRLPSYKTLDDKIFLIRWYDSIDRNKAYVTYYEIQV